MAITVEDIMSQPAIFIDPAASVAHAATLMRRRRIHSLVISLEDDEYGIVTTTDIRDKIVATEADAKQTAVREIMSSPLVTAEPGWSLKDCSIKMKEIGAHHLPVTDSRGMVIGMISAIDIFMAVEESGWESRV